MVFDPTYNDIDLNNFRECNWKNFYGDVKEVMPPDMPKPLGKEVELEMWVDSDHAGDRKTRRSRTGFFIFMNKSPIVWFTRRQDTIETAVFGSEFVAMKTCTEANRALCYKLRMMGVPIEGPTYTYGDNMSVIHNTSNPESTLKKKSNSICYHAVRESVAMGEMMTAHVKSQNNLADLATKVLGGGWYRKLAVSRFLWYIYS